MRSIRALNRIEERESQNFVHYKQDISYIREDLLVLKAIKDKVKFIQLEKDNDKYYLIFKNEERYLCSPNYKIELSKEQYYLLEDILSILNAKR